MALSDKEFDFLAHRLSEDVSTSEQQLEELGAEVFSTAQLIELRGRFRERLDNFHFFQKQLVRIALWSPLPLLIGAVLLWFGLSRLGLFILMAFPTALAACLVGIFLIYQNFGGQGRMEHWIELVEDELKKRKGSD